MPAEGLPSSPSGAGIQPCGSGLLTHVTVSCGAEPAFSACGEAPYGEIATLRLKWIPAFAGMTVA
jgi:hypothetical protein